MYATNGRTKLWYELHGDPAAPPLVMIRGLARTRLHWGSIVDEVARDFRVLLFDNRGVGKSDAPLPPYTTAAMADDTAAVMDAAGFDEANVFGISLGGMIAQQVALRHGARVRRLALGCTRPGGRASHGLTPKAVRELVAPMRKSPEQAIRETAALILSRRFLAENASVVEQWVEIARREPPKRHGVIGQLLAGALHDASGKLDRITAETLVVTGDVDRLIDPRNSELIAKRIPRATLRTLSGAGHDFPTEQPRETAALLREFFLR